MSTVIQTKNDLEFKLVFSLLLVAGFSISGLSVYLLGDEFSFDHAEPFELVSQVDICKSGDCNNLGFKVSGQPIIQLNEETPFSQTPSNDEMFSNLKLPKQTVTKKPEIFSNKIIFYAQQDSFIREGIKNSNEGSSSFLRIMGQDSINNRVMIKYDQNEITPNIDGKLIESAILKLFVIDNDANWNSGQDISIHRLISQWDEGSGIGMPQNASHFQPNGVTWTCSSGKCNNWNGGNFEVVPTDSVFISNHIKKGYWIKFDVTEDLKNYLSGEPNYGWVIKKSDEGGPGRINFAARESTNMPELVVVQSK